MDDKQEACKQQSVEACPCEHLGVIKFLTIHIETIEAYTFAVEWRNIQKKFDYNTKYSPIIDNCTLLW
jgi:hypothetical protein